MTKLWDAFEKDCTEYLNKHFGSYADFIHEGGHNSNVSDIKVITKTGKTFYIDAKHCPAQCGQFVLLPNEVSRVFEYSNKNTTHINPYAQKIIHHMNMDFDSFKDAGTKGKAIILDDGDKTFSNWIIDTYKNKGTCFFITNDFTLLPISDFSKHFNVTATYRIKRSGSSAVGKANISNICKHIPNLNYNINSFRSYNSKLFVKSNRDLHNLRFTYHNYTYMFSQRGSEYEIRKLSNTHNANVIFSITKKPSRGITAEQFIHSLQTMTI